MREVWQVYRVPIILGSVSLLFIVLSIIIFIKSYQKTTPITFSSDEKQASMAGAQAIEAEIFVDVEGAVIHPGVYFLPIDSRVDDALILAGGFSSDADMKAISSSINRAAKLSDGAKLYIPREGDTEISPNSLSSLININLASQSELESLAGIGEVTAGKIISNRPYTRLEELVEKKAIGQSVFEKIKDQLAL